MYVGPETQRLALFNMVISPPYATITASTLLESFPQVLGECLWEFLSILPEPHL